jgi:predicted transcriptional regulator of viral defense system
VTRYATLDRLACRQHGLVTAAQLAGLGYSPDEVRLLVATGRLIRVRRGVYRLCGVVPTWRSAALAAVLAAGERAVLSHRSAGVLWGLLDRHHEAGPLELIVPGRCRLQGVRAHRHRLAQWR